MSQRVEINPRLCGGQPMIKGPPISVAVILEQLADYKSWDSLLRGCSELTPGDIQAVSTYLLPRPLGGEGWGEGVHSRRKQPISKSRVKLRASQ